MILDVCIVLAESRRAGRRASQRFSGRTLAHTADLLRPLSERLLSGHLGGASGPRCRTSTWTSRLTTLRYLDSKARCRRRSSGVEREPCADMTATGVQAVRSVSSV
jgi:hypothetical protein